MANNTSVRRHVVQVSEIPVGPAVQTLCVVGNELCAVTQQDIRKVVDFRMFTLGPWLNHCQRSPETASSTILLDLFAQEPPKKVKLDNNPYVRREVLKVSEIPMAPAVHIPIVVGCEQYVVIQQDIRKEMDIRMFTYSRLGPVASATAPIPHVTFDPCNMHIGILKKTGNDVALGRSNNQICYSAGTSTDGLMKNNGCQHCPKSEDLHSSCQTQTSLGADLQKNVGCQTQPATACTGCNTSSSLDVVSKEEMEVEEEDESCDPCTERELFVQQGPILRNRKCPQDEPCTSRLINMEDRRRYDCIRARIWAQRLAERRRQRQQDCNTTPQPPPPTEWLSSYEDVNRECRQWNTR
ncbi:uncharacterized protein LOC110176572 isoform X2 [Drosophila serrata]|uniref:uncharacterized protein LOC110176572 isoform X2 n=1 Tax=Drosophila serrata TaxID=7274 RepID=UPI000A1D2456|nr:uncharacterized protein LOC110176572 isoform X2 [Drosophila serrata]